MVDFDSEKVNAPHIFWCIILSIFCYFYIVPWVQPANRGFFGAFVVFPFMILIARLFAMLHVSIVENIGQRIGSWCNARQQIQFEKQMLDIESENQKQEALAKRASSKKELIMRLGSIDQYIRVLQNVTDTSKKIATLQSAQSEITTLSAQLASEQIISEMVRATEVREHALETSKDLSLLGLTEDRLYRDIARIFQLEQRDSQLP